MKTTIAYNVSRWIMALLFIFSGLTKSVNPFGFSIQFGEYLTAMGLTFLKPLAPLAGIALPSVELLLGVMLALGLGRKIAAWGVMLFMCFFTLLTLWIALANPVSDCGCFGDILIISNWATFWKNLVLMPFAIVVFMGRNRGGSSKNALYAVAVPASLALAVYSYFNLPLIDATPYKTGVNISQAMSTPEGAPESEIETVLIYKNIQSGDNREFKIEDEEWQDESRWEYVDTKSIVLKEGYVPPIKNLPMIGRDGVDHASEVLNEKGKVLLVATNDFNSEEMGRISDFGRKHNAKVVMLISAEMPSEDQSGNIEMYHSDHTVIYTIIQNEKGGALLLDNGTITRKFVMRELLK